MESPPTVPQHRADPLILLISVFLVAICALIYELVAGAVSSYLLGSSVTQFSLVIGLFLTSMGIGSFLTRFVRRNLLAVFFGVELAVGLAGGFSAVILFAAFVYSKAYFATLVAVVVTVGTLIGMEIPLLLRILRERAADLRVSVSQVMTFDYAGALLASLAFPFFLAPHLGLLKTSFLFGLMNVAVCWIGLLWFRQALARSAAGLWLATLAATFLLLAGFFQSNRLVSAFEDKLYADKVILATQTPYQRIVLTRWKDDIRLFLNAKLQFATPDEYRYHEALVHPAMSLAARHERVLILGGGDGMAAREALKYPDLREVVLVDIDPEMTRLFRDNDMLASLSGNALRDPRVRVVNEDAQRFLEETDLFFDVVLSDLPDPNDLTIGKLYTISFYRLLTRRLNADGVIAVQATSPFFARQAYWCIANTLDATPLAGPTSATLTILPYHANVPSFGEWGFVLAAPRRLHPEDVKLTVPTRYLTEETIPSLFRFPADMARVETEINRLDNQALVRYYDAGWQYYFGP
ncbi:MAG: polyamine aminopropyltransferase [Sumerlaeia bacterium]